MNELIISASLRQNSFSLAAATARFPNAKVIFLKDLNVGFCRGCGGCDASGVCVIKDDMPALLKELDRADRIILAFPVYFDGLPAQLKAVVDRLQQRYAVSYGVGGKIEKTKELFAVSACGGEPHRVAEDTVKYFCDCIGAKLCGYFCAGFTDDSETPDLVEV